MDISHKYCYTNFEQLNIDFLLESVADHSNKITQLRTDLTAETTARTAADNTLQSNIDAEAATRAAEDTAIRADLQTEINTRIADVEVLTAEDEALTAFANAIQADLNQEIIDRIAADTTLQDNIDAEETARKDADAAVAPVLFHLSYGQGGVLDCLPDEANDIIKAFDENRRSMVHFASGEWFERISIGRYPTLDRAVYVQINNIAESLFGGKSIILQHVVADDTHTFIFNNYELDTASNVLHITSSSNNPDVSATFTTTDNLWAVEFMNKNTYIELTCPGTTPTRFYTRSKGVINESLPGSYSAEYVFSYWDLDTRYDIDIVLSKTDVTDPTTWTATMTGRKKTYETVS